MIGGVSIVFSRFRETIPKLFECFRVEKHFPESLNALKTHQPRGNRLEHVQAVPHEPCERKVGFEHEGEWSFETGALDPTGYLLNKLFAVAVQVKRPLRRADYNAVGGHGNVR